jgi:hypothetical protein
MNEVCKSSQSMVCNCYFAAGPWGCRCYEYYKLQNYGQDNHLVLMFVGNLKLKTYDTDYCIIKYLFITY